mmetsp:Transcript_4944/g.14236  ORF Transcript_4944/g.14236 Transcript_4944/m.14236 type:complete len:186 (+) Transcript_4944:254-811(+)
MPKPSSAHGKQRRPHALGLAKFADAKTSTYDKQARKQKERALNSKVVNKYRKLRARLDGQAGGPHAVQSAPQAQPDTADVEEGLAGSPSEDAMTGSVSGTHGKQRHKKPESHIQRIAREKAAEKAAEQRAREEAKQEAQHRQAQRQQSAQQRKKQSALMRKKTRSGQPVMKFRINKILGQLQGDA